MYDGDEFLYDGETYVASLQYSDNGHSNIYHDSIYPYPNLIQDVPKDGLFYRYPYRFGNRHIRPGHHPVQVYDRSQMFYPHSLINGNMFYNGILKKKDGDDDDFMMVYRNANNPKIGKYDYYVLDGDYTLPLKEMKELHDGDEVEVPHLNNSKYVFTELDN